MAALTTSALLGVAVWATGADWEPERAVRLLRGTGWTAVAALLLSLSASPLAKVVGRIRGRSLPVAPWRRLSGIAAAALASLHAALALSTYLADAWAHVFAIAWLRAGASCLLILLALWLTSFPAVTRALRIQHWKALHRLAYVAGLLAFQHTVLAPFSVRGWVLAVFGTALLLGFARFVPAARAKTS